MTCRKAAPVRNYLEVYSPCCAGGLSAVNAIGTQLCNPINALGTDPMAFGSLKSINGPPPPSFYSAVWRTRCPCPCLVFLSGLSCTAYICIVWLPFFLPYVYYMWLPWFISLLFLAFSLLNPFMAMMSFAG